MIVCVSECSVISSTYIEEYNRLKLDIPFGSEVVTKNLTLRANKFIKNTDLEDLHMNTEQFTKYTEIRYWLELIEYDVTCTHGCLIYLSYESERNVANNTTNSVTLLENVDYSFFFDSAISKLFSLIERVSQFINCLFSLELIEDKLGSSGVSIKNVIRRLEEKGLYSIKDCISHIDQESMALRKIRNAVTHHFHPLNSPFYKHSLMNGVLHIDEAILPVKIISNKTIIASIQKSYININEMINMIVGIAIAYFKIDCVLIKDRIVVDAAQLEMSFEG